MHMKIEKVASDAVAFHLHKKRNFIDKIRKAKEDFEKEKKAKEELEQQLLLRQQQ